MMALFVGDILMKPDTFKAIGDELPKALPSIPASALMARRAWRALSGVSSFSPRRAYSAIGLVAYILLMEAIPAAIYSIGQTGRRDLDGQALHPLAHHVAHRRPATGSSAAARSRGLPGHPDERSRTSVLLDRQRRRLHRRPLFRYRRIPA
jgi:hypothetical protein